MFSRSKKFLVESLVTVIETKIPLKMLSITVKMETDVKLTSHFLTSENIIHIISINPKIFSVSIGQYY